MISEKLLQFIWQHSLLDLQSPLRTTDGQEIIILKPGTLNHDAGPDFLNAKVKIGDTTWAGNIEMHTKASDWVKHKHDGDKNYEKLILHVVYEDDKNLELDCSTLILNNNIPKHLLKRYDHLMELKEGIPCASQLKEVEPLKLQQQMNRALVQRLESKTAMIHELLEQNKNDWSTVFYIVVARSFGLRVNADAFEQLARNTPLKVFSKHNDLVKCEALLFGQAGMLNGPDDCEYFRTLKHEYKYLKHLHGLKSIDLHLWKFLRLRPANFPSIRIAQFAQLLFNSQHLFSKILEIENSKAFKTLFDLGVSSYWQTHYRFHTKESPKSEKKIGKNFIELIMINAIIPTLFMYGKHNGLPKIQERALDFLNELKAEDNKITRQMASHGFPLKSAFDSQALIELKKVFCDAKKCLDCSIGYSLLKS